SKALGSGQAVHRQVVRIECLDGTTKSLLQSASPLRALDGATVGAVLVLRDLGEHRQVEADFEQRIAHLVSIGVELEGATRGGGLG
ncbi:MAG: hypothetical protein ACRENE_22015, partial [Polyangiaceae bacterium]